MQNGGFVGGKIISVSETLLGTALEDHCFFHCLGSFYALTGKIQEVSECDAVTHQKLYNLVIQLNLSSILGGW